MREGELSMTLEYAVTFIIFLTVCTTVLWLIKALLASPTITKLVPSKFWIL